MQLLRRKRRGLSYQKRVEDVNAIYDKYVKTGLTNREIWRRYIHPRWGYSERTFYYLLKAAGRTDLAIDEDERELLLFDVNDF